MTQPAARSYRWLLWSLMLFGLLLDLATKYVVFRWLHNGGDGGRFEVYPGVFRLLAQYTSEPVGPGPLAALQSWSGDFLPKVNHGALFGLGQEYVSLANGMFATVSVIAAVAIAYWGTRRQTATDLILCMALGLILAGTLGNLYDRVVFNGVRDFFHFYWIEWPVFNVADCCLVSGAFLLLTQAFLAPPLAEESPRSPTEQPVEAGS